MRRFLFVVLAVTICAACTKAHVDDSTATMSTDIPETIYVSLEDDTRVQLDANGKTVWTAGDELTAFYRSDANSRFTFRGNTGDRNGGFTIAEQGDKTMDIDEVILLYPYSEEYKLDAENRCVDVKIPATQRYEDGSYGVGANLMASVETGDNFTLKSLCGWIAVQFKGAGKVMSVTLTGNNSEQLAGDAQLNYDTLNLELLYYPGAPDDDTQVGGSLIFGDYQQTITLDCGDGVELHYTEPTEFYFVVAPQTFANGITIEATCSDGTILTKSSSNALTVERNHIVPMSPLTVMEDIPDNQIWYISTDGNIVEPNNKTAFDATLISNVYKNGKGVMTFEGAVTEIGAGAFEECSTLSNITIPENVETIGDYAFIGCSSLANLIIPDNVTTIGESAFEECGSLTSLTIPNGVTTIADYTFAFCDNLTSVNLPYTITSIGADSFIYCSRLKSIIIPDNVTSIGAQAFDSCTSLTDVTMGKNVSAIGRLAFFSCSSLSNITIPDNITTIEDYTFAGCENLANVTIPDSVTVIDEAAFSGCASFTSMTIPDSVTTIGVGAFSLCYNIENLKIGNNVTTIGDDAFEQCSSLTSITIPDSVTTLGKNVFMYCFNLQKFNGKFATEDGCCLIDAGELKAYAIGCGLAEYTIPDGVTTIGEHAFTYCYDLTSVTIPDSVKTIAMGAFMNCRGLTEVVIPDSVTSIESSAFNDCNGMESMTIGSGVTTIGDNSFGGCTGKLTVNCNIPNRTSWNNNVHNYVDGFYGADFTEVIIGDSVQRIGAYAFTYLDTITIINIPDSVTTIGTNAFFNCHNLSTVNIGSGVTEIESYAFYQCNLKSVYCKPITPPSATPHYSDGRWSIFPVSSTDFTVYVPVESVDAYKSAEGWSDYADDIVGYDF